MGTQSHETMAMEAAMAERALRSTEPAADIATEGTAISAASNWDIVKAKGGSCSAAGHVDERATATLRGHIGRDPMRAMLIAAGTGAIVMGLVTMLARSGARTVRRNLLR